LYIAKRIDAISAESATFGERIVSILPRAHHAVDDKTYDSPSTYFVISAREVNTGRASCKEGFINQARLKKNTYQTSKSFHSASVISFS
jgi:hypothetical protein